MENYVDIYLDSEEKPLAEASFKHTEKLIYDFNRFAAEKRHKAVFICFYIVMLIAFAAGIANIATLEGFTSAIFACIGFSFPALIAKSTARSLKDSLECQSIHNYRFYNEYFVESTCYSVDAVPYSAVMDSYENKDYIYIFISANRGYIIPKSALSEGMPFELRKLLKERLGGKFDVRCSK